MIKIRVGERVTIRDYPRRGEGTIKYVSDYGEGLIDCAVEFDKYDDGYHNCGGHCKYGHGLWVFARDLESIGEESSFSKQVRNYIWRELQSP